jgi:ParB family chromosome partitioning protein
MSKASMMENLGVVAADFFLETAIMVDVKNLHDSPDNFFAIERIEELADTILEQGGIKATLVVKPINYDGTVAFDPKNHKDGYEIISGHRRAAAIRYLLKKGKSVSKFLPCTVMCYEDNDDKKLDIVLHNVSSRIISDSEMWKAYECVNEVLQKKKAEKSPKERLGRVRDKIAEVLGISTGQVNKMNNINANANIAVKEAVKSGEISIYTANRVTNLDAEKQQELLDAYSLAELTPKIIEKVDSKKGVTRDTFFRINFFNYFRS